MRFDNVTAKNALLYAAQHYDNPQCLNTEEFVEDYKRFKYIKRLVRRYTTTKSLRHRLLLNHLMLLNNVFGADVTVRILFYECGDAALYAVLKPFLVYMNILPDVVRGVGGEDIYTNAIPVDPKLQREVQALDNG